MTFSEMEFIWDCHRKQDRIKNAQESELDMFLEELSKQEIELEEENEEWLNYLATEQGKMKRKNLVNDSLNVILMGLKVK